MGKIEEETTRTLREHGTHPHFSVLGTWDGRSPEENK
jgi:hypothetical protein